jgi:glycosyltransferase involved in cell wall biosynthesis
MSITAVVITRNEERNIERCLDSIDGVADEVVVVDCGSSDRTQAIAAEKGARVIEHVWEGYGVQKNFGNAQATHSYILSLDADEALSDELRRSLIQVKEEGLRGAYGFPRLANYCGKWIRHGGWYPDKKIRLFPRAMARWSEDAVHESLEFDDVPEVTWLTGDLLHYSYYTFEEHQDRARTYARLGAKRIRAGGQSWLWCRLVTGPSLRFLKTYVWKLGLLDGVAGYRIAKTAAYEVRMKYRLARAERQDDSW